MGAGLADTSPQAWVWGASPALVGLGRWSSPALTPVALRSLCLQRCQLDCSDHGHCDFPPNAASVTFWMENFIKVEGGMRQQLVSFLFDHASWFGIDRGSELSGWVLVFPRQMSK